MQITDHELNIIKNTYKSKIYEKSQEALLAGINNTLEQPKLRTYKLIKSDLRLEPYLLMNLN